MNTAAETECVGCSSSLTVVDVFNALQASYAFISGTFTFLILSLFLPLIFQLRFDNS